MPDLKAQFEAAAADVLKSPSGKTTKPCSASMLSTSRRPPVTLLAAGPPASISPARRSMMPGPKVKGTPSEKWPCRPTLSW